MDRTLLVLLGALTGIASPVRSRAQDSAIATRPTILAFSGQAQRFLALEYRAFATEFLGCLLGEVRSDTVLIERIAPADVDPAQSTATHVVPQQTCEAAGWGSTLGLIHSHPTGEPPPMGTRSCSAPTPWMRSCAATMSCGPAAISRNGSWRFWARRRLCAPLA